MHGEGSSPATGSQAATVTPIVDIPNSAAGVVITPDFKIIAIEDAKGRGIILPGGKVERGESPRDGMARELFEETGLRAVKMHAIMCARSDQFNCYFYFIKTSNFNTRDSKEGKVVRATFDQLRESAYGDIYVKVFKRIAENMLH